MSDPQDPCKHCKKVRKEGLVYICPDCWKWQSKNAQYPVSEAPHGHDLAHIEL